MEKKNEVTLVNSRSWLDDNNYIYDDYVEYCEMNHMEPEPEGSHAFFEWRLQEAQIDVKSDLDNIKSCNLYQDKEFVVIGSLGLWTGRHDILPIKVTGLYQALLKCFRSSEDYDVTLNTQNGVLYVNCYHHDGCNCFEIHQLRDYCSEAFDRAYDAWNYGDTETVEIKKGWFRKIQNLYSVA